MRQNNFGKKHRHGWIIEVVGVEGWWGREPGGEPLSPLAVLQVGWQAAPANDPTPRTRLLRIGAFGYQDVERWRKEAHDR